MTALGWRFALGTSVGPMHARQGTPGQDRAQCRVVSDLDGEAVLLAVVSDGAGSAERSEVGSELACRAWIDAAENSVGKQKVEEIDAPIALSWLASVRQKLAQRADADNKAIRDYACTLVTAVVGSHAAAFMQTGDGAIVTSKRDAAEWGWVFWPQRGEFANTTFFVTDNNFAQQACFKRISHTIDDLALFTDGIESLVLHYASKSVHRPFFDEIFAPVWASRSDGLDEELCGALERYLSSPIICNRSDDDKSLILASRRCF